MSLTGKCFTINITVLNSFFLALGRGRGLRRGGYSSHTPHPDLLPSRGEGIHPNILREKFSELLL